MGGFQSLYLLILAYNDLKRDWVFFKLKSILSRVYHANNAPESKRLAESVSSIFNYVNNFVDFYQFLEQIASHISD